VEYDRNWEPMLDEAALRAACVAAFDFHLIRRPQVEARIRIPGDQTISSLTHADLLNIYWDTNKTKLEDAIVLTQLAGEIINSVNHVSDSN
jgi:exonuclease SbcD